MPFGGSSIGSNFVALDCVRVNELPDTPPQYSPNEDIRIENDHLSGQCSSRDDVVL